ncbi:MAG: hypothetical protein ACLR1R_12385 [Ruminococcus callidus]
MPETLSFCVPAEADGERLDKWLSGQESLAMTRSALQVRMEHGDVTVNGKKFRKIIGKKQGIKFWCSFRNQSRWNCSRRIFR